MPSLKDACSPCQALLCRLKLVAYTCFTVSKWWQLSRANYEPKAINHTKGRWCTPATSQSMSAAASLGSETGAETKRWCPQSPPAAAEQPHGCTTSTRRRTTDRWARSGYTTGLLLTLSTTGTWTTTHQSSNTPSRTTIVFLLLCWSIWSRKAPGHTGAVGCPDSWWMQPVFWISCFTSSLPRTGTPCAPEARGWLHGIPRGTRSSYSSVWGCSEANCRPACPKTTETQNQTWLQHTSTWTKEDVKFHFDIFHDRI